MSVHTDDRTELSDGSPHRKKGMSSWALSPASRKSIGFPEKNVSRSKVIYGWRMMLHATSPYCAYINKCNTAARPFIATIFWLFWGSVDELSGDELYQT